MKCLVLPHPPAGGGPGTFQTHLEKCIEDYGWCCRNDAAFTRGDAILVVIGTRKLFSLLWAKVLGKRIIHRLDGINWQHRYLKLPPKKKIIQELRNFLMLFIRNYLADVVVYQSTYIRDSWCSVYGRTRAREVIIYNGTDLDQFSEERMAAAPSDGMRVICVEGSIQITEAMLGLFECLSEKLIGNGIVSEILLVGNLSDSSFEGRIKAISGIKLIGVVPREEIAHYLKLSDVFLCLELFPPCPNSVIEAMASGLPVVGYDTGALSELVGDDAGVLSHFNENFKGQSVAEMGSISNSLCEISEDLGRYSKNARLRAEKYFGRNEMIRRYVELFLSE